MMEFCTMRIRVSRSEIMGGMEHIQRLLDAEPGGGDLKECYQVTVTRVRK